MSSMSSIPHEELPILEALINIRNRLTALKKDSSEFIRSHTHTYTREYLVSLVGGQLEIRKLRCQQRGRPN